MLDADRSPNAVSVHAGTSQVDFEVDRPPPAPPGHLLITMVKEAVYCTKNEFRKVKKVVSLIDLKVMKTRNDCENACDCVKRANVVLHVGLCKEIFARKHTATHKPTSAQPLYHYQRDIHTSNKPRMRVVPRRPSASIQAHTDKRVYLSLNRRCSFHSSFNRETCGGWRSACKSFPPGSLRMQLARERSVANLLPAA